MRYIISRISFPGSPVPVAIAPSREEANKLIADLEAKDPKGAIIFYSREPMVEAAPKKDFRVSRVASAIASFCD